MFRRDFSSPADFLVHDILRLTQYRLAARYAKIFTTFFVSGLLHLTVDLAPGMAYTESGSVRFFCMQTLDIVLEDTMQAVYRANRGISRHKGSPPTRGVRALG